MYFETIARSDTFISTKSKGTPMTKVIDAVYESGVLRPLQKIDLKEGTRIRIAIEEPSAVIKDAFGLLKGKDTTKALKELDDEWGLH